MQIVKRGEKAVIEPDGSVDVVPASAEVKPEEPVVEVPKVEEKPPEPKVVGQVLVNVLDNGQMVVQTQYSRDETIVLLRRGREVLAKAIASGKD